MKQTSGLRISLLILVAVAASGVAGYMVIEGWSFLDALYMTVTTLTTVGYREVGTLHTTGRVFTILLIVVGVGAMLYTLTSVVQYSVEGQLTGAVGRRRMRRKIEALQDHYLLCGYGRVGKEIAEQLTREGVPFVVVDIRAESVARATADGLPTVVGDATHDDVLISAGIERAKGLIAATAEDSANIYVTLSGRGLRPDLFIVARSNWPDSEAKLTRAGANRVISPYAISGRRIAMLAVRPLTVDFIDTIMNGSDENWVLEEIDVAASSAVNGRTVREVGTTHLPGATVLAIVRESGQLEARPGPETTIQRGDRLIVMGRRRQLRDAEQANLTPGRA